MTEKSDYDVIYEAYVELLRRHDEVRAVIAKRAAMGASDELRQAREDLQTLRETVAKVAAERDKALADLDATKGRFERVLVKSDRNESDLREAREDLAAVTRECDAARSDLCSDVREALRLVEQLPGDGVVLQLTAHLRSML